MYHYIEAITNTRGDALIGYYVKVTDSVTGATIPLYADNSATPIIAVSGLADAARVDSDGNASFYIDTASDYDLNIYATDGSTLVRTIPNMAIAVGPAGPQGPAGTTDFKRPELFGAVGDGVTDDAVALQAWLDSGGNLLLSSRSNATWFRSSAKLYVRKKVNLRGEKPAGFDLASGFSGYQHSPGSRIVFDAGVSGFDVQTATTVTDATLIAGLGAAAWTQEGADYSSFSDFALVGNGGDVPTAGSAVGFTARILFSARNVRVTTFSGKGWDLTASTSGSSSEYGNLSNSVVDQCSAEYCGSHGIHVRGIDSGTSDLRDFTAIQCLGWGMYLVPENAGCLVYKPVLESNALGAIYAHGATNFIVLPYIEGGTGSNCSIDNGNIVIGDIRSQNTGGYVPAIFSNTVIRAVANSAPALVVDTLGGDDKITLQDSGTVRCQIGSHNGIGVDFRVVNADGNPTFRLYNVANARLAEFLGKVVSVTANTRLGASTGMQVYYHSTNGAVLEGGGSSYDVSLGNNAGTIALRVPTGTTNVQIIGTVAASNLSGTNTGDETSGTVVSKIAGQAIAPLSTAIGSGTVLTKAVVYTPSITPASVTAATVAEQTFTVTGLTTADKVIVNPPAMGNSTGIAGARVSAADTLAIRFTNPTAGALTPASGTYTVLAFRS